MTPPYELFLESVVTPLSNIEGVKYRKGHIRVNADSLRKNANNLPCVMASYIDDEILEQTRHRPVSRTNSTTVTIKSNRKIAVHGIVSSIDGLDDDYLEKIEDLLHKVKAALRHGNLKFIKVGYILDTEQQSLGLAGFVLILELIVNENYE